MNVRRTSDIAVIRRLHSQIFPADDFPDDCIHWLLTVSAHQAGFCSVKLVEGEDTAFMARAGVLPKWRGQGCHGRMLRVREAWARKRVRYGVTYVLRDNYASLANLIKAGWRLYEPAYRWAGDVFYLQKDLHG